MERIEGLVREGQAITAAYRTSYAMSDGKALAKDYDGWQRTLRTRPGYAPGEMTDDDETTIAYIVARWTKPALVS